MNLGRSALGLLVVFSTISGAVAATEDSSWSGIQVGHLSVRSNIDCVKVFVDTLFYGETPMGDTSLPAGTHILRFVHPDMNNWLLPAIVETLSVNASDLIVRTANFPFVYHITSNPYGASVHFNDSIVGQTPLMFSTPSTSGVVTLTHDGCEDVLLPLPGQGGMLHAVMPSRTGETPSVLVNGEQLKSLTPIYMTSGAAVITGALAAYFKIKADGYYNEYRNTGDRAALDRVRRLDTLSGIALVTSEASLLMLSYLLFSR